MPDSETMARIIEEAESEQAPALRETELHATRPAGPGGAHHRRPPRREGARGVHSTVSTGYAPTLVSPESMTASAPSSTAFATSDASARVGRGLVIIESKHLRGHDDGLRRLPTPLDRALLDQRHAFEGHLDAEVAPGDHHPVEGIDHGHEVVDGLGLLQLRDHLYAAADPVHHCVHEVDVGRTIRLETEQT